MRKFMVVAKSGEASIRCGIVVADSPGEALVSAQKSKSAWAATQLSTDESNLSWEVEEDFL